MAGRKRGRPRKQAEAPGLPMTGAELDALQGDARKAAELERAKIVEDAVAAANRDDLPKLGGELTEIERGPIA